MVQTHSYGPEARGGASQAEVIVSDQEIDYPEVLEADILLCMSQQACDKYHREMRRNGLLIVDTAHVRRTPTMRVIKADLTGWALEETQREITASIWHSSVTTTVATAAANGSSRIALGCP